IERIASLFKSSSSRNLHNLVKALGRGDLADAEFAAHGLRGTLSMLGAGQASQLAKEIEAAAARHDAATANELLPAFQQAISHVARVMDSATMR
ncbi:MAG: Hpt domain-containing protein, partial [Burkholderiaceae bacterium]|nr:Hpt domain-containing protein [Burkholderiaceae bacterium]